MAQAIARKKGIQSSPVKMRLVLEHIRGKKVTEALSTLHFMTNKASLVAEQTLRSAIANFQLKDENRGIDVEDLVVSECYSDGGPMLKRIMPAPMGRAYRVRKRSNQLTIVVSDRAAKMARRAEAAVQAASAPAQVPAAEAKPTKKKAPARKKAAAK